MSASLEVEVLEGEVSLHDARGLHTCPQHVLLGGDVVRLGYPVQVVQVAVGVHSTGEAQSPTCYCTEDTGEMQEL